MAKLAGRARDSRNGAALLEILMVIAILVILVAIILPLFAHSRKLTYRVKCASNLKQFAAAFGMYSTDWDGFLPSPGGLVDDRSWHTYWSQTGNGGLEGYINQRGINTVWCCPILREWGGRYPPRTYSMNSYLRNPADVEYPSCVNVMGSIHVGTIAEPARTMLLFEGIPFALGWEDTYYYIYRCANWTWARGYYTWPMVHTVDSDIPWHAGRNNYLYCDGHVISRIPGIKTIGTLSTDEEMYEWYVDKQAFIERSASD